MAIAILARPLSRFDVVTSYKENTPLIMRDTRSLRKPIKRRYSPLLGSHSVSFYVFASSDNQSRNPSWLSESASCLTKICEAPFPKSVSHIIVHDNTVPVEFEPGYIPPLGRIKTVVRIVAIRQGRPSMIDDDDLINF